MTDGQIRNPDWNREAVIAHFGSGGSHAEFYRMLQAVDRDFFLNSGYSRRGQRHWSVKGQLRLVDRLAGRLFKGGLRPIRLLDIGCGRGGPAVRARERWQADVTAIDICPQNIDRAILQARRNAIVEGLYFRLGDGMNLPFGDGEFPYVWSIESAAYMPDKARFFSEIGRVLTPGGRLALAAITVDEEIAGSSRFALDCLGRFLQAWDMPYIESLDGYDMRIQSAGLHLRRREDATTRTLRPHAIRLRRFLDLWANRLFYRTSAWYVRRKTGTDLDLMREQLVATCEAVETGVIRYGLLWAEKPTV